MVVIPSSALVVGRYEHFVNGGLREGCGAVIGMDVGDIASGRKRLVLADVVEVGFGGVGESRVIIFTKVSVEINKQRTSVISSGS